MERYRNLVLIVTLFLISCAAAGRRDVKNVESKNLRELASWMSGYFTSQKQSESDSSYYDIRLRMKPVWKERTDGFWLYVEQAMASHQDRPYRQRVYHLIKLRDNLFESRVYSLGEPLRFAGDWRKKEPLSGLTPDSLTLRRGCSIILRRTGEDEFTGNTVGRGCRSDINEADYATSIVILTPERLLSWDRGFNSEGEQVWGARKGGYVFIKIKDYPLE